MFKLYIDAAIELDEQSVREAFDIPKDQELDSATVVQLFRENYGNAYEMSLDDWFFMEDLQLSIDGEALTFWL